MGYTYIFNNNNRNVKTKIKRSKYEVQESTKMIVILVAAEIVPKINAVADVLFDFDEVYPACFLINIPRKLNMSLHLD